MQEPEPGQESKLGKGLRLELEPGVGQEPGPGQEPKQTPGPRQEPVRDRSRGWGMCQRMTRVKSEGRRGSRGWSPSS